MAPAGFGHRVEGLHAVEAAARAGRVTRLWVERSRSRRPEVAKIIGLVDGPVEMVDDVRSKADTR